MKARGLLVSYPTVQHILANLAWKIELGSEEIFLLYFDNISTVIVLVTKNVYGS